MVPLMAIAYMIVGLFIIVKNITHIPADVFLIFQAAFSSEALGRCVAIATSLLDMDCTRTFFGRIEALGSTPHAHAVAKVDHPFDQGVVAIVAVFIDTFIVLTITVFTVLSQSIEGPPPGAGYREIVQRALTRA